MDEKDEDLAHLPDLLDLSAELAGSHLKVIITPECRLTAGQLSERLTGMRLLALATVTADGRPLVAPVDGIFYRGAFHFGSSSDSVRIAHLRVRPAVSATHLPGEEMAVTVHGRAALLDMADDSNAGLRRTLLDIYVPRYGPGWEDFLDDSVYARIDADRMFAFHME